MDKVYFDDLSFKAYGLYLTIKYLNDNNMVVNRDVLLSLARDSKTSLNSGIKELKDAGLLTIDLIPQGKTRGFKGYEWALWK